MLITTKAIVLSSLKYGETSLIVKAFTEVDGLKSYVLKGVRSRKKGMLKASCFLPLMLLEVVATHKNKDSLDVLHEAKIFTPYRTLHTDIVKTSLVLFLAEMLSQSLREQEQDQGLFSYLEYALQWLDGHETVSNFHLLFLLKLSRYLGFYPNTVCHQAQYFDLQEGDFCTVPTLNPLLEGEVLQHFIALLGMSFATLSTLHISKKHRQELLKKLVLYFELHVHGFRPPKSLAVLNAVFQ